MIAILLPGLHGNGKLYSELTELLSISCTCWVIDYPNNELLPYDDLVSLVKSKLPSEKDFFIIAESFSGPVAYQISLNPPDNLKFVVYGASFIDNPNKVLIYLRFIIPYLFKLIDLLPNKIINLVMLGNRGTPKLVKEFKIVLRNFPRNLFRHRLNLLARLSLPMKETNIRAVYIRPLFDYLVTKSGFGSVSVRHSNVSYFEVKGTHFLFQSNPRECANIVLNEAKNSNKRMKRTIF